MRHCGIRDPRCLIDKIWYSSTKETARYSMSILSESEHKSHTYFSQDVGSSSFLPYSSDSHVSQQARRHYVWEQLEPIHSTIQRYNENVWGGEYLCCQAADLSLSGANIHITLQQRCGYKNVASYNLTN